VCSGAYLQEELNMQRLFTRTLAQQATQQDGEDAPWLFVTAARSFATFTGISKCILYILI
jgi:hypothetical protein